MIFKFPESAHESPLEKFKSDFANVLSVIDPQKSLEKDEIVELYRIGKRQDNHSRPMVIKLKSLDLKKQLLGLRNLSFTSDGKSTPVFIAPDRTNKEIEVHKTLVAELKKLRGEGRTNLVIRGGKIVEKQPFRFKPHDFYNGHGAGGATTPNYYDDEHITTDREVD